LKKGEQPEFSAKWWKANQPKGLKTGPKLEDALKDYETTKQKLEQKGDPKAAEAAEDALDEIAPAVKAVIAEASKIKGSAEMDATVETLKKFDKGYRAEESWIEEHTKDDKDSNFTNPDEYKDYLRVALKRIRRGGEMNFGLVLGKSGDDHRLALHRSKGAKALGAMLADETGLHAMTFGVAAADEKRGDTLCLKLEGRQLPGMQKKGERMLHAFKPLPFTKMALMVEGKEKEDEPDPDDKDDQPSSRGRRG
jgi:hypothetical protein